MIKMTIHSQVIKFRRISNEMASFIHHLFVAFKVFSKEARKGIPKSQTCGIYNS